MSRSMLGCSFCLVQSLARVLTVVLLLHNLILASPALVSSSPPSSGLSLRRSVLKRPGISQYEADRIVSLPGQPAVDFAMFAGYVTVNERAGRAHYYFFVEAEENPEDKPLVVWFNGGPGCSSIAYGFAEELGPFFINPGGKTLRRNPHPGNKVANVLFVESPAGTGLSYSNNSNDLLTTGDNRTAIDNFTFVRNWFKRFPHYKGRPFFLIGESYAGFYIPQLSRLIYRHNREGPPRDRINFQGFMVGNPVIDSYNDNWGYIDYLYYHAMISDQTYSQMRRVCNFSHENVPISDDCILLLYYQAVNEYGSIDPYSIYSPACTASTGTRNKSLFNSVLGHVRRQEYDPCTYDYSILYFNRPEVQKAMHANVSGTIPYPWAPVSS